MIYFDAAFIAKCYLNEAGADIIRGLARQQETIASCELSRIEVDSVFRRHWRERRLTPEGVELAQGGFVRDESAGVWRWLPLNSGLVEAARRTLERLPEEVVLRAGDALHLACARQHGFAEIYSNDRRILEAARWFGLEGVNPLASPA
ncbi:MAG: PIN domain-containing protein [Acidobacteria bacterium]|nr:MAG: PIN domain-containing protein [Acidobacteriota bacterium]